MLFFIGPINEFDALHHIKDRDVVLVFLIVMTMNLLWHRTSLVLQEVERIHHVLNNGTPMLSNREHSDDSTSQAII